MENLIGVVLCGGKSSRMGRDKGQIELDGKPWALCISEKLKESGLPVVISINEKQKDAYQKIFPETPLIVDELPLDGPLEGLLSVHINFPDKDILLMACDLIDMQQETILDLIKTYRENPSYEYYVYEENGFHQTFCAIYTAKGLAKVYKTFEENSLGKYSLHDRFESGNTMYIPVKNDMSFKNYNTL
ncbi:molybdenum cofactor guanylyltransferase [Pedobacter sp. P351]|uniref:molybdenum cofactor guanylyltransferase n=1 Tax=Pedobacter superstes TaxID=3133441 RepID=UPI0030ABD27A